LWRPTFRFQFATAAMIDRNRELWALALRVEQLHGGAGRRHIADMIGKAAGVGDEVGIGLWKQVASRYHQLASQPPRN
jgi:hypothetical protein